MVWCPSNRCPANNIQSPDVYTLTSADEREEKIQIAAIDNGLAFPFKHPDEWRGCKEGLVY